MFFTEDEWNRYDSWCDYMLYDSYGLFIAGSKFVSTPEEAVK
jgi:hypothetical protein